MFILAAIQFTHILDFMIMMPLGESLMRIFEITPLKYSFLTAIYSIAASIVGFLAGFVMDRIPRRSVLLWLYAGFAISTIACAMAETYLWLLCARTMAGICGGVASSVVGAMVADVVPPHRRGRAMAVVATAFPLAQVMGLPAGLGLASKFGWHAPFYLLGFVSLIVLVVAVRALPSVPLVRATMSPLNQMKGILTHPIHIRGFILSGVLLFAGALVAPFMAPSMQKNVGFSEMQVTWMYTCGGIATFFSTNLFGRLSDRFDKLYVLAGVTTCTVVTVLIITRLGPSPLWISLVLTSLFFVTMSGRFAPAMSMVANAVDAQYRGGFMSVNAALQQACGGMANIVAGLMITEDIATGRLVGYQNVGLLAAGFFVMTVFLAAWLRAGAPHAARNSSPMPSGH
ncbi:MAG: MFS transporter [Puniceicoccales bacterium]|nr:MFS transporter [Puniceicoccales bacterium]